MFDILGSHSDVILFFKLHVYIYNQCITVHERYKHVYFCFKGNIEKNDPKYIVS